MTEPDPSAIIIKEARETLGAGHTVWLVGHAAARKQLLTAPQPPPRAETGWWFEPYGQFWIHKVNQELVDSAQKASPRSVTAPQPVTFLEDIPLFEFNGYHTKSTL
jgi:hypothetical protein